MLNAQNIEYTYPQRKKKKSYDKFGTRSKNELCILLYDSCYLAIIPYFPITKKVTSFGLLWKFIIYPSHICMHYRLRSAYEVECDDCVLN